MSNELGFRDDTELARCDAKFAELFGADPVHRKLDRRTKHQVWNAFRSGWLAALLEKQSREGEHLK